MPPSTSTLPSLLSLVLVPFLCHQALGMPLAQPAAASSQGQQSTTPTPVYLFGFDITTINKLPNWAFNLTILGLVLLIIVVLLAVVFVGRFAVRRWRRSAQVAMEDEQEKKKKAENV